MKTKVRVNKYRRNDGTPVRTHTRKIDVDVFKPEKPDNNFDNKNDSPKIEIDKSLVQNKNNGFPEHDKFQKKLEGKNKTIKINQVEVPSSLFGNKSIKNYKVSIGTGDIEDRAEYFETKAQATTFAEKYIKSNKSDIPKKT